jgi:hypothetical protein
MGISYPILPEKTRIPAKFLEVQGDTSPKQLYGVPVLTRETWRKNRDGLLQAQKLVSEGNISQSRTFYRNRNE